MKEKIKKISQWLIFTTSATLANANNIQEAPVIEMTKAEVKIICDNGNPDKLQTVNDRDICEELISMDNGKTWMTLAQTLAGWLLLAGLWTWGRILMTTRRKNTEKTSKPPSFILPHKEEIIGNNTLETQRVWNTKRNQAVLTLIDTHYITILSGKWDQKKISTFYSYIQRVLASDEFSSEQKQAVWDMKKNIDTYQHDKYDIEVIEAKKFHTHLEWNYLIAKWYSDWGKSRMDDYVSMKTEGDITHMIVLDWVSGGDDNTPACVEYVWLLLENNIPLSDLLTLLMKTEFVEKNIAMTIWQISITKNTLCLEKIWDIWIVIFDKNGKIKYQHIGWWYIPDSWYGSQELINKEEINDIIKKIETNFTHIHFTFDPNMTKNTFVSLHQHYTQQMHIMDTINIDDNIQQQTIELTSWDTVCIGSDGIFDNLSFNTLSHMIVWWQWAYIELKNIFKKLHTYSIQNKSDFWSFKVDNMAISIYHHTKNDK